MIGKRKGGVAVSMFFDASGSWEETLMMKFQRS
jgi:hypothetical protein